MPDPTRHHGPGVPAWGEGQLEDLVRRIDLLAPLPATAARAVEILERPPTALRSPSSQLRALIGADVALAAGTLAAARRNSAPPPATIEQAIDSLPAPLLHAAVLAACAAIDPTTAPAGPNDIEASLWCHSLAAACAAAHLATSAAPQLDPQEAYACGLLHDLGRIALVGALPKSYRRVLQAVADGGLELAQCERQIIGVDPATLGRRLAEQWHLPSSVAEATWLHQQRPLQRLDASPGRPWASLAALACAIANQWGFRFAGQADPARAAELAAEIGVSAETVESVGQSLASQVEAALQAAAVDWGNMTSAGEPPAAAGPGEAAAIVSSAAKSLARIAMGAHAPGGQSDRPAGDGPCIQTFLSRVSPEAAVTDVLAAMAVAATEFAGPCPSDEPILCYSISEQRDAILVVRSGDRPGAERLVPAPGMASVPACPSPGPAHHALGLMAADASDLGDWAPVALYHHQPISCGGQWAGGIFCPPSSAGLAPHEAAGAAPWHRDASHPTHASQGGAGPIAVFGAVLALAQGRAAAVRLSEDLANTSRELLCAQATLAQGTALSAVGELASGAAHELNNPLAVISGRAQLMRDQATNDKDRRVWELIVEQAQRISDIVTGLMDFASPPTPVVAPADVDELLRRARDEFMNSDHPQAKASNVDITTEGGVGRVAVDADQVVSVLRELLANAATAAGHTPHIRIVARADEANRVVLITVADNGPGMDKATLESAFVPFFSGQQAGRRRGLGLPKARRCIQNNGGRIWIRSEVGKGATVFVSLPRAET